MSNALTVTAPEGLPFVDITREFDAPVEKVFAAYTDPQLFAQWVGPRGYAMDLPEFDVTTGGHYRFIHRDPQGNEYAFRGVFHTVRENELIVQTFEFAGVPDTASIEYMRFERLADGRTRLTGHAVYPSLEARDGIVASGMETGIREGYEKLDDLVA